MEPLKNTFSPALAEQFALTLQRVYPAFDIKKFTQGLDEAFKPLELKERSGLLAERMSQQLPVALPESLDILRAMLKNPEPGPPDIPNKGFFYWPISDYLETVGRQCPPKAMEVNYWLTRRFTAEFSIRPLIEQDPEEVLEYLHTWCDDECEHVRRLVSEGTRPRLPWAPQLKGFIEDPTPLFPLLRKLMNDPSLYVRRSVANHLNDIGKDHSDSVVEFLEKESLEAGPHFDWICRHALRSHIKRGDTKALAFLGYHAPVLHIEKLRICPECLALGDSASLSFKLVSELDQEQGVMVDYVLYRPDARGRMAKKVFKLKALNLPSLATVGFEKGVQFKPLSTRSYYPGEYRIAIQVNGVEMASVDFQLAAGVAH